MSKKETRHALGLPTPDYRHKVYGVDETVRIIVEGAREMGRVAVVGNRFTYERVTGLRNYSKKRWEQLKVILRVIALKREFIVDGEPYILQSFSPMMRGRFNFYIDEEKDIFHRRRPCAGFTVHRNKG